MVSWIDGGVCAAQGFRAAGLHVGVKTHNVNKKDVALIVSDSDCAAAAVFTTNVVKAAPIHVTKAHLADGRARAVVANSGNANACAPLGEENAERMCAAAAKAIGCGAEDVLVCSTGVIGQTLRVNVIEEGMEELAGLLTLDRVLQRRRGPRHHDHRHGEEGGGGGDHRRGKTVRIGGIAKGSGMIHPNMGTMLCFITTDCSISPEMIREALVDTAHVSFNRISVDGDTSTNDTCLVLANGLAGNETITGEGEDYAAFLEALKALCVRLARMMAKDGEGARHLITCTVAGAKDEESAQTIAKSVISSTLTKAAIFGCDANWGRVLCAMGYSGEEFDPDKVDVAFASAAGEIPVCRQGRGLDFDEDLAKRILTEDEVEIRVRMGEGDAACTCWGCDITYDYIKINGDYRT